MASDPVKKLDVREIQGPDYRSTAPVNKPTQVEIMVAEMRTEMRDRFETVTNLVLDVGQRVSTLESAETDRQERARKHSMGLSKVSVNDAKQDAAIANIITTQERHGEKLEHLTQTQEKQLAILDRLDKVAANPTVRRVAYFIGAGIIGWMAAKGWIAR